MGCSQSSQPAPNGQIDLSHFELHRVVGKGAFGTVQVIEHKSTKSLYACKYVDKQKCLKAKAIHHILQERRLLEKIDHPHVVNLRFAFQDNTNCFFVLDFLAGGSLRHHLKTQGRFSEQAVRLWTAELSSAIAYLHGRGIIHRDVKPDNILLDSKGHAHISDFNIAVYTRDMTRPHTTVAGSVAYMAPEVIDVKTNSGYHWEIDWWSLGVCIYELLWHKRPFDGPSSETIMESIRSDQPVVVPATIPGAQRVSAEGCDAIRRFLSKKPSSRLGCRSLMSSLRDIQRHPWLSGVSWKDIDSKTVLMPFVPPEDEANFDLKYEFEAFVQSKKPLSHKKVVASPQVSRTVDPDLSHLEELFTVYDYRVPSAAPA
ncbi:kinase-like domain-containing protein [Vararia minispora EC-137]|uniref:Kinase-like domain-containing protein n=1 Tax=Vararia minispora EC-137 TaxID=1314806 RepID=A0ACB8QHZ2_9AGAM|nr:kinase-like domain-containing protein [Vararia minispora EC-137]